MKEYLIFRFRGEEILQILNESEVHLLNDSDIYEGKIPVEDERFEILRRKWIKWYNRNSTKCGTYLSTLQSEASVVNSSSIEKYDLFISRQLFGVSRGYLYYEPLYFCSQKFRRMVETEKLKGIKFEVAHIVDPTL